MKEKFELIPMGEASYRIRRYKKHWWSRWKIEMDGMTPKIYPVDQKNCNHRIEFVSMVTALPNRIQLPLYRCIKCGYEQIGKQHLCGQNYEQN